jgi:hypothetical protein
MVILDIIMPEMSGTATYGILKEIHPKIKILLSSGTVLTRKQKKYWKKMGLPSLANPSISNSCPVKSGKCWKVVRRLRCPREGNEC